VNVSKTSHSRTFPRYDPSDVPSYYGNVLLRIEALLESKVRVHEYDDKWLTFTVQGHSDRSVILRLVSWTSRILPGCELFAFQILCPWDASDRSGLLLHYLQSPADRLAYRCGCWFYE
jgi:hypothetical protein